MNKDAFKKITKARIRLIAEQVFFGVLALNLKLVEDATLNPPTLATDSKTLRYHPDWVMNNTLEDVQTGVAHEVCHCVLQHCYRGAGREPGRWGHAIDYATNDMLVDCGFKIPQEWIHDPVFHGLSADKIYSLLPPGTGGGGGGNNFDPHMKGGDDPIAADTQWQMSAVQAATAQRTRNQGTLPGSLQRYINELLEPEIDWRQTLRRFATDVAHNDYSWARPARRSVALGVFLPSLYSEGTNDLRTVIDTSGSIDEETLTAFATEISDIRNTATPNNLGVMYCDADVNQVDEFGPCDDFHMDMHGGGGTDFRPPFEWLAERNITPNALIYLTDGYGSFPAEPPDYPVLWVMTTDVQPPWGESVRLKL
jgi:predicted metal-dependent peptidase